ncbi:hypothetical protein Pmani_025575 [Petrolisthes manimaculis]|uniref:Uncharacterized protein n=1 Tax=Petrolisthes manimaculis TaxID=1843537 RepID=A0AAE1P586_9EUCA|nr:hypothetical protein Pmani_025575 [Petrolisthes manimaculis]
MSIGGSEGGGDGGGGGDEGQGWAVGEETAEEMDGLEKCLVRSEKVDLVLRFLLSVVFLLSLGIGKEKLRASNP